MSLFKNKNEKFESKTTEFMLEFGEELSNIQEKQTELFKLNLEREALYTKLQDLSKKENEFNNLVRQLDYKIEEHDREMNRACKQLGTVVKNKTIQNLKEVHNE